MASSIGAKGSAPEFSRVAPGLAHSPRPSATRDAQQKQPTAIPSPANAAPRAFPTKAVLRTSAVSRPGVIVRTVAAAVKAASDRDTESVAFSLDKPRASRGGAFVAKINRAPGSGAIGRWKGVAEGERVNGGTLGAKQLEFGD